MASKDKSSEQTDVDILQCRADILRARDTMPPYAKTDSKLSHLEQVDKNANHSAAPEINDIAPIPAVQHNNPEIPKFDLAEDIMAEQRRITAIKRKAPGKKIETVSKLSTNGSATLLQWPKSPEQEQIIAEIVARDIEKLCRGNILTTGDLLKGNNQ